MDHRIVAFGPERRADLDAYRDALDELVTVQAEIDRLQAERARRLARVQEAGLRVHRDADDATGKALELAHRSLRLEVAMSLRASEYSVGAMLGEAQTLVERLPATLAAVEGGRMTYRAASVIAGEALRVDAERCADFDEAAVRLAASVAPSRLRARLRVLRERIAARPAVERHEEARAARRVVVEDDEDGMSWLHAYLPSVEAHAIDHRLRAVAHAVEDLDADEGVRDGRTLAQRRADLLVELVAADFIPAGGSAAADAERERRFARGQDLGRFNRVRAQVVVTVPVQTLLDADIPGVDPAAVEPPMLDGIVPIDPATARELAANAPSLYRLLVDPHTGARLDLGRERYQVSTGLRLWLRLRDGTCRAPGCGRPAQGCDLDHTIDWQYGGATRADNLAHLCRGHHTLKHQTRTRIEQHPDGTITWRTPTGREYSTRPSARAQ